MAEVNSYIEAAVLAALKASSDLDDVQAFMRGTHPQVAISTYPLVEVWTEQENPASKTMTGYITTVEYTGMVAVHVVMQDTYVITDREVTIASYAAVQEYTGAIKRVLKSAAQNTLGGLSNTDPVDWSVIQFDVVSPVQYGIAIRDQRQDVFTNYGIVPFRCRTNERHP